MEKAEEKRVTNAIKELEVQLFVADETYLTAKQKEKLKTVLAEFTADDISGIEYFTKIGKKVIKVSQHWGTIRAQEVTGVVASQQNKYVKDNVGYNSIQEIKEIKEENVFNDIFEIDKVITKDKHNIQNIVKNFPLSNMSQDSDTSEKFSDYNEGFKDMLSLFDADKAELLKQYKDIDLPNGVRHIVKVIEGKNQVRFALMVAKQSVQIYAFSTADDKYNYIDENRCIYIYDDGYGEDNWVAFDITEIKDLPNMTTDYKAFLKIEGNKELNRYVDSDECMSAKSRYLLEQQKIEREKKIAEMKNKKYQQALDNMKKVPLEKNGIKFYKHRMVYEGIDFDTKGLFDFQAYLEGKAIDEIADFNTIFNSVIKSIAVTWAWDGQEMTYDQQREIEKEYVNLPKGDTIGFTVDKKDIELCVKDDGRYYINDIRINKKEIPEVLTHLLCYQKMDDYTKFLETVSSCSLKFHKAISNGVKKQFYLTDEYTSVELKMVRDKNVNYLLVGKDKYQMSDTNMVIDREVGGYSEFVLMILKAVNINIKKVKPMLSEGIIRYQEALLKSKKLLDDTKKMFGVTSKSVDGVSGYSVKGMSGREYLIQDSDENNFKVWEINNGKKSYRCIVDRSSKNQMGKDGLVSRIYALANDKLVAKDIHTLKA